MKLNRMMILGALVCSTAHAAVTYTNFGATAPTIGAEDTGSLTRNAEFGWGDTTGEILSQSFTLTNARTLDAIYVLQRNFGSAKSITVDITIATGGTLNAGTSLYTETGATFAGTLATDVPVPGVWLKFDFSGENITLPSGQSHFQFKQTSSTGGGWAMAPQYNNTNPYAGGSSLSVTPGGSDVTFAVTTTTVPEPSSLALLGLGFLGLLRRRR